MGEIFWGVYQRNAKKEPGYAELIGREAVTPAELIEFPDSAGVGIGSGWGVYRNELMTQLAGRVNRGQTDLLPRARAIARLGASRDLNKAWQYPWKKPCRFIYAIKSQKRNPRDKHTMQAQILKAKNEAEEYYFEEDCFILELSNSPADPDVESIARVRVKPGVTTKLAPIKRRRTSNATSFYSGSAEVEIAEVQLPVHPQLHYQQKAAMSFSSRHYAHSVITNTGIFQIERKGYEELIFLAESARREKYIY